MLLLLTPTCFGKFYLKRTNQTKQTQARYTGIIDEAQTGCVTRCLHESLFLISSFSQASMEQDTLCKFTALSLIYIYVNPCLM